MTHRVARRRKRWASPSPRLREKKPVMLASLAERFGVSELEVAEALPDDARASRAKTPLIRSGRL